MGQNVVNIQVFDPGLNQVHPCCIRNKKVTSQKSRKLSPLGCLYKLITLLSNSERIHILEIEI